MIYRLRTETEAQMIDALSSADLVIDGEIVMTGRNHGLVIHGDLFEQVGVNDDGEPVMQKLIGYHANLSTDDDDLVEKLKAIAITPKSPLTEVI